MSGSTWRGAQLRIAEAKPTYTTRYILYQDSSDSLQMPVLMPLP